MYGILNTFKAPSEVTSQGPYSRRGTETFATTTCSPALGSVFAIILNRPQEDAEKIFLESQRGFRAVSGTIDVTFCDRQLREKAREQQKPLFLFSYDLEKAHDSVPREATWAVMWLLGIQTHLSG